MLLAGVQMAQGGRAGGDWQWQNPESRAPDSGCEVDGIDKVHRARCTLRGRSERAAFPGPLALQPSGHGDSPLGSLDSTPSGEEERHGPPPMRNRSHSHSHLPVPVPAANRFATRSPVTLSLSRIFPAAAEAEAGAGARSHKSKGLPAASSQQPQPCPCPQKAKAQSALAPVTSHREHGRLPRARLDPALISQREPLSTTHGARH